MTLEFDKCVICGRGRRTKAKRGTTFKNETLIIWNSKCGETLSEILFGNQSLTDFFSNGEFCKRCLQLVRDVDFTYRQLQAFQITLDSLSNLLRRNIQSNFSKSKADGFDEIIISNPVENVDFNSLSHGQRTQLIYTMASKFVKFPVKRKYKKHLANVGKRETEIVKIEPAENPMETSWDDFSENNAVEEANLHANCEENNNVEGSVEGLLVPKVEIQKKGKIKRKKWKGLKKVKKLGDMRGKRADAHKKKRNVACTEEGCSQKFLSEELMKAHIRGFHLGIEKPHECPECSKCFGRRIMMMHHIRVVHKKPKSIYNYFCKFCSKGYITEEERLLHYSTSHLDPDPFRCAFCPEIYSNSVDLRMHMKKIHPEPEDLLKPQCNVCHKFFSNQNNLMVHSRLHGDPEKIPKCDVCNRIFANKGSLRKHTLKKHAVDSLFTCETCGKSFTYLPDLTEHAKRHNETEKKYGCKVCDRKFFDNKACRRHEVSHTGIKEFVCHLCGKCFGYKGNLTAHQKIHSEEERTKGRKPKEEKEFFWQDFSIQNHPIIPSHTV